MISEEQVLNGPASEPEWLRSEKTMKRMLKSALLRETAPNTKGWTTLEFIPRKPMFKHSPFERTRKDNAAEPEDKLTELAIQKAGRPALELGRTISEIERTKVQKHIEAWIKPEYRRDATRP